ncbi:MAG: hypothetical protein ACREE9_05220 [Stellaceae bacterium]
MDDDRATVRIFANFRKSQHMLKRMTRAARRYRAAMTVGVCFTLASLPNGAFALDTQPAWQGIATTTASTSAQCDGVGGSVVGDAQVSVFRPKIRSTDDNTYLSFVYLRAAVTFQNLTETTVHQMHGSGGYGALGVDSRAKFIAGQGRYTVSLTPFPVTEATPVVTIIAKINNFFDVPGCNVTFHGVYAKRID